MTSLHRPILYPDFAGVLHPGEVYRIRSRIVLRCDGMNLFEWAPLLAQHLEPSPGVPIQAPGRPKSTPKDVHD
jgi:hypothetical protein